MEYKSGKKKGSGKSAQKKRWRIAMKRVPKVSRMRRVHKEAAKVWFGGCMPSMSYGAEVTGASKSQVRQARSVASKMTGYGGCGTPAEGALILRPEADPAR
eukprot:5473906-Karenia_brevis.AAC.1